MSRDTPRPRSALDQQVAEARQLILNAVERHAPIVSLDAKGKHLSLEQALDALLTTHRRQVLTEIEAKLHERAHNAGGVYARNSAHAAARFVASLRDTKENV